MVVYVVNFLFVAPVHIGAEQDSENVLSEHSVITQTVSVCCLLLTFVS